MKRALTFLVFALTGLLVTATVTAQETIQPPSGWFFIKSVQAGGSDAGYWDQPGTPKRYEKGANLMVYAIDTSFNNDQQFRFVSAGGGWYFIQARNGGYVDVAKGENRNGTNICIWEGTKRNNQKFRFQHLGNGRIKIYAATGGIACLKGQSHEHRSNIHIWRDHAGAFTEWYFIDASTRKTWRPATGTAGEETQDGSGTRLYAIDYDTAGRASRVDPGITEVEIWLYNPSDAKTPYRLDGTVKTDAKGKITLPTRYSGQGSALLMARRPGWSTAVAKIYPKSGRTDTPHFVSKRYRDSSHILVSTKYRGDQWYVLKEGSLYREEGLVTSRPEFFYYEIRKRSSTINRFLNEAFPGISTATARTDQEIVDRIVAVFAFTGKKTRSSMGGSDPLVTEASDYLFRNCRTSANAPVSRWPSLEDYADTWIKYGFIPTGNCTHWSQMTSTFLYAAGVPADRFGVIKFHYDPSWLVEHWVIGLSMNNRWYALEPQHASSYRFRTPESLIATNLGRNFHESYDYTKPFEIWVLPGSGITGVPYVGDPEPLLSSLAERSRPVFFEKNPMLNFRSGGLTFKGEGSARVLEIKGNTVTLKIAACVSEEGPGGWMESDKIWTIDLVVSDGVYIYSPAPGSDYVMTGTVSEDGRTLNINGDQSGMTFTAR